MTDSVRGTSPSALPGRQWRRHVTVRRALAAAAGAALLVGIGVVVALSETSPGASDSPASDSTAATSMATVIRGPLSSQTQVSGTLEYADSSTIVVPTGTTPSALRQAEQAVDAGAAGLRVAEAALVADNQALAQTQARLEADRRKRASDCSGPAAASASGDSGNDQASPNSGSTPCATVVQAVATDEQAVRSARQQVATDRGQVASAQITLSGAQQSLTTARSSATAYDTDARYTMLPSPGDVVRLGQPLYAINDLSVLLLYGGVTAWRPFRSGMPPGRDVAALNRSLRALGHTNTPVGDDFTSATRQALIALQAAHGLAQTGELALGSVVFAPGPLRVTTVEAKPGAAVQPGPVLSATSIRHQVSISLAASRQSEIKVGDGVTVTLPDGRTTPGVVSKVGSVATATADSGDPGATSEPTIEVDVKLSHRAAAGRLDQAPVQVGITTASVRSALAVPVNALLALAGEAYAVEVLDAAGVHRVVPVRLGLFDDASGLVQVAGAGLHAGQRIVVPAA
jgi:hypothetical protein